MKNKINLQITEQAYYKILDQVGYNSLPLLIYSEATGYGILASSAEPAESARYQVGRLIMVIPSDKLVEQVSGRIFDYDGSKFIVRDIAT